MSRRIADIVLRLLLVALVVVAVALVVAIRQYRLEERKLRAQVDPPGELWENYSKGIGMSEGEYIAQYGEPDQIFRAPREGEGGSEEETEAADDIQTYPVGGYGSPTSRLKNVALVYYEYDKKYIVYVFIEPEDEVRYVWVGPRLGTQ